MLPVNELNEITGLVILSRVQLGTVFLEFSIQSQPGIQHYPGHILCQLPASCLQVLHEILPGLGAILQSWTQWESYDHDPAHFRVNITAADSSKK
jgi:hypothetical protein